MKNKQSAIALAFVAAGLFGTSAFAATGFNQVGGERGAAAHQPAPGLTRGQVTQEFLAFRANPVGADGGVFVGGEIGWEPHRHVYKRVDGRLAHADAFPPVASNQAEPAARGAGEQRAIQEQYVN
jgi:hypothetical protein